MNINDQLSRTQRRAKARLTDMIAFEVSLVDRAANLRRWVIVKRNADMSTTEVVSKVALPSAARQAMLDGISGVLEKLTAIASMIGDAEIDDAATVPAELAGTIDQCSEMLRGVAEQYMEKPSGEPEVEVEVEAEKKAAPAEEPMDESGKACKEPTKKGEEVVDESDVEKQAEAIAKAGRKIARARFEKLLGMQKELESLIKELSDVVEEEPEAKSASESVQKEAGEQAVAPSVSLEEVNSKLDTLTAIVKASASIQAAPIVVPTPNGGVVEGAAKPTVQAVRWSNDLAAEIKQARSSAR